MARYRLTRRLLVGLLAVGLAALSPLLTRAWGWTGPEDLPRISDREFAFGQMYDGTQEVSRQKLVIKLPRITTLSYVNACSITNIGQLVQYNRLGEPSVGSCPGMADLMQELIGLIPPEAREFGMFGFGGRAWFQSPVGTKPAFGRFPPITIRSTAFGSIPVTATAHISQPVRNGFVQPMEFGLATPTLAVPGGVVIPPYGPSPTSDTARWNIFLKPKFTGPLDIRLSDVKVDGVGMSVGSHCAASGVFTATPREGWYNMEIEPEKGQPGEWGLAGGGLSYLPGNMTISKFSGCGTNGEDLNPLLTGLISGDKNPVDLTQNGGALLAWCLQPNPLVGRPPGDVYCDFDSNPMLAPPEAATVARQSVQTEAASRELLASMPAPVRKQLASMTPSLGTLQGQ